jgi:hypothetical protein
VLVHGTDLHDAMHEVMDEIGRPADEHDRRLLTMHTSDGDPQAFAEMYGFASCPQDPI